MPKVVDTDKFLVIIQAKIDELEKQRTDVSYNMGHLDGAVEAYRGMLNGIKENTVDVGIDWSPPSFASKSLGVTDSELYALKDILKRSGKISAIRELRSMKSCGLKEAKDYVEELITVTKTDLLSGTKIKEMIGKWDIGEPYLKGAIGSLLKPKEAEPKHEEPSEELPF